MVTPTGTHLTSKDNSPSKAGPHAGQAVIGGSGRFRCMKIPSSAAAWNSFPDSPHECADIIC